MWNFHEIGLVKNSLSLYIVFFICSCINTNEKIEQKDGSEIHNSTNDSLLSINSFKSIKVVTKPIICTLELLLIENGLIDIQTLDSTLKIDVRYSSLNNFMKEDVYGELEKIYLQKTVAQDLVKSNSYLKSIDSNLVLLVYDGVRPRSVQQKMWDVLDMPIHEKTKFVSNPKNGSIHNYGCAIDLTIVTLNGDVLDMGARYDDIRKIAYPRHEDRFLKSGELLLSQVENRKLLRKVMKKGGFYNIQTEWWHFNRYNRTKARTLYRIIE